VLTRVKKLAPADIGFARVHGAAIAIVSAATAGILVVTLPALAISLARIAPLAMGSNPPGVVAMATGFLALAGSAALQQLALQSFVLAASEKGRPSIATVIAPSILFVATHVDEHSTPLVLLSVALFGIVTTLLFFRTKTPSYLAPIAFHTGWNFALVFILGCPTYGPHDPPGFLRCPADAPFLSGGALGFHGGLVCTLVLAAVIAVLLRLRKRSR
jgi:hypothetical protein